MAEEIVNYYLICEIVRIPKKIQPLIAWRLKNKNSDIIFLLDKIIHP